MKDLFTGEESYETVTSDWARDLITVLKNRGGATRLENIYTDMERLRRKFGRSWPDTAESTVRCTLQRHSRGHPQFQGEDLFVNTVIGMWELKKDLR